MFFTKIKLLSLLSFLLILPSTGLADIKSDTYPQRDYRDSYNNRTDGCGVTFFDKENFRGRSATLYGEQDLYDFDLENFVGDDPDSVIVGYRTQVWLFEDEGFRDLKYYLRPNTRAYDLDDLDDIESIRIRCY